MTGCGLTAIMYGRTDFGPAVLDFFFGAKPYTEEMSDRTACPKTPKYAQILPESSQNYFFLLSKLPLLLFCINEEIVSIFYLIRNEIIIFYTQNTPK